MTGGATSGSVAILLLFSAIDLLCSAMICGVLLTVVLIGGAGVSREPARGDAGAVGVTTVDTWTSPGMSIAIADARVMGKPTAATPDSFTKLLLPDAQQLASFMLAPGRKAIRVHTTGASLLVMHSGTGEELDVVLECKSTGNEITIPIVPRVRLPTCEPLSTAARARLPKVTRVSTAYPSRGAELFDADKDLKPADPASQKANRTYVLQADVEIPQGIGIWAATP